MAFSPAFFASAGTIFTYTIWTFLALSPILFIVFLFYYRSKLKKFPIEAVILERRGDTIIKTNDTVGRIAEEGIVKYKLKIAKDTMPVLNYDWILHNSFKPTNLFEKIANWLAPKEGCVILFKYGSKQYKPVKVMKGENEVLEYREIKDNQGLPVMINVYTQINPHKRLSTPNFDVINWDNMNFLTDEVERTIIRRVKKSDWMGKYAVPIAMVAVAGLCFILALYYSTDIIQQGWGQASGARQQAQQGQPAKPANIPIISDVLAPGS